MFHRCCLMRYIYHVLVLVHCVTIPLQSGFTPETYILTPESYKPIAHIHIGELVISQCENGELSKNIVINITSYATDHIIVLTCDNVTLCTDRQQHLFTENHKTWKPVDQLHIGDTLLQSNGSHTTIQDIQSLTGQYRIYTITVQGTHTIHISSDYILAHNEFTTASTLTMGTFSGTSIAAVNPVIAGGIAAGVVGYLTYSFFKKRKDKNKDDQENTSQPVIAASGGADGPGGPRKPRNNNKKQNIESPDNTHSFQREYVLPKAKSYEQARNKALELIGDVDWHNGEAYVGNIGIGKNKIVGRMWCDGKVVMRLDWDYTKGPHINVEDWRPGKGNNGLQIAIPFEGDYYTIESLLKHLQR